jgi:hypothetical protein
LPFSIVFANGKAPHVFPISEEVSLIVEPLSEARTPLADFFSILLEEKEGRTCGRRSRLGRHTTINKQSIGEP